MKGQGLRRGMYGVKTLDMLLSLPTRGTMEASWQTKNKKKPTGPLRRLRQD